MSPNQAYALANEHIRQGRLAEAATLCQGILAVMPEQPDVLHLLGVIAYQSGQKLEALQCFQRALAARPDASATRNNLGCTLIELGRFHEAITEFELTLQATPSDSDAHSNLADALYHMGRFEEAAAACRTALSLQPSLASAHNNLGNALRGLGQYDAAKAAYQAALRFQPRYADAQSNLGAVLSDRFDHEGAVEALGLALQWNPQHVSALNNLSSALMHLGRLEDSVESQRRALELAPDDPALHSNLIYTLQFLSGIDPRAIAAEQARWEERHAHPLRASIRPHPVNRDPARRLRVGYVSPDLREHPIAFFLVGILAAHDRTTIESHCYASVSRPDAVTARLRQCADVWHDVFSLSHEALAEKIRADAIDILVDLSMHSADNRLPVFARKPAPVQVSWLAYPGATGLAAIDYRLTDATLEPHTEATSTTSERPIALPDAWCCYEPIGPFPDVSELPATDAGFPTFGSFSKTARLSDRTLHCWGRIAARLPEARWILLHPEGAGRERVRQFFGESARLITFASHRSWVEYLQRFASIDVCLDTFPGNGLTATCHALWMGTPVITLAGKAPVERAGASILTAAGFPEFIAPSEGVYESLAVSLANDPSRLAGLRATLRDRMRSSALMDASRFTRNLEAAFRTTWQAWCAGKP